MNINALRWSAPVVVFSIDNCKWCREMEGVLNATYHPLQYRIVKVDKSAEYYKKFREELISTTGWSSYPFVFQDGEFIGGFTEFNSKILLSDDEC